MTRIGKLSYHEIATKKKKKNKIYRINPGTESIYFSFLFFNGREHLLNSLYHTNMKKAQKTLGSAFNSQNYSHDI